MRRSRAVPRIKPKARQKLAPAATDRRRRNCGLPRRHRARGAAPSRQARHDAPAIGASFAKPPSAIWRRSKAAPATRRRAYCAPSPRRSICPLPPCCRRPARAPRRLAAVLDLVAQVPEGELPDLAKSIEARVARAGGADRARRIALVGLRGAGKSTLGRMLAAASRLAVHRARPRRRGGLRRQHSRPDRDGRHRDVPPS